MDAYLNFDVIGNPPISQKYLKSFWDNAPFVGNSNSIHNLGAYSKSLLDQTNEQIKKIFNYNFFEFIPGGGSCANKRAILGSISLIPKTKNNSIRNVIIFSLTEHQSIRSNITNILNKLGYYVIFLPVTVTGIINVDILNKMLQEYVNRIALVSIIYVNNETGKIQPLNDICNIIKLSDSKIIIHSDVCHALYLIKDLQDAGPDIISLSCYKFGGPHMGLVLSNHKLSEDYSGTPDTLSIMASTIVLEDYFANLSVKLIKLKEIKTELTFKIETLFKKYNVPFINLSKDNCCDNIVSYLLKTYQGKTIQKMLSDDNILIGTGSACLANKNIGSYVVRAYGFSPIDTFGLIRFSFDEYAKDRIDILIAALDIIFSKINFLVKSSSSANFTQLENTNIVINNPIKIMKEVAHNYDYDLNLELLDSIQFNKIKCAVGELYLKGDNKEIFVKHLKNDIVSRLHYKNLKSECNVITQTNIININPNDNDVNEFDFLQRVPGIACYYYCYNIKPKLNDIMIHIATIYNKNLNKTFKIETKLKFISKFQNKNSQELNSLFGQYIVDRFNAKVDLDNPEINIWIEITNTDCDIYTEKITGLCGLPINSTGKVRCIITHDNLIRSLTSIIGFSVRGCVIDCYITLSIIECSKLYDMVIHFINSISPYSKYIPLDKTIVGSIVNTKNNYMTIFEPNDEINFTDWITQLKELDKQNNTFTTCALNTTILHNYIQNQLKEELFNIKNELLNHTFLPDLDCSNLLQSILVNFKELNTIPTKHKTLSLISGGIDSPVSSYLIENTETYDCQYIHFTTDINKIDEIKRIIKIISNDDRRKLYIVHFKDLQDQIYKICPTPYRTFMYKIFMLKIAELIANKNQIDFLVTGNSLGQVASQTFENLIETNKFINIPIMSPLLASNKQDIVYLSQKIGTYKESICGGTNDCCVLYLPKHPVLKANFSIVNGLLKKMENYIDFVQIDIPFKSI